VGVDASSGGWNLEIHGLLCETRHATPGALVESTLCVGFKNGGMWIPFRNLDCSGAGCENVSIRTEADCTAFRLLPRDEDLHMAPS
jgi:hypothetical protein